MAHLLKALFRAFLALAIGVPGLLAYCSTHVPSGDDADDARRVGQVIAAGYPGFDDRATVERTGQGRIYYWAPRSGGRVIVSLYGVTSTDDITTIEGLARQALRQQPRVQAIELRFHERLNLTVHENGSTSRAAKTAFKTIFVARTADT